MLHSLRSRLLLSQILPALIIFPCVTLVMIWLIETYLFLPSLSKELIDETILIREIAKEFPTIWHDPVRANDFVYRFHPDPEDQLMLISLDQRLLATSDSNLEQLVGHRLELPDLSTLQGQAVQTQMRFSPEQNNEIIEVLTLVYSPQQQPIGVLRMTYVLTSTYHYLRRFRYFVIGVMAGALVLRIVLGLLLARPLERPLFELTDALNELAQGKVQQLPERGVTELRLLARAFNGLTARLQLLESTRQQLLANLIHEIRRPLGALKSAIHALQHGASEEPALRNELLTGINNELGRFHHLVDDLALLYQQTLGPLELNRRPIELATWLPSVLAPWRVAAREKGIAWQSNLTSLPATLLIDPDRLAQVIGNLLSNAVKFTPSGGQITVTTGVQDDLFWLRVSDTGPGIPLNEQAQIFAPFYRSHTNRALPQGMGLGLTIAQDLVAAHHGQLTVESTPGAGSHFTLWLPLSSLQSPPHAA